MNFPIRLILVGSNGKMGKMVKDSLQGHPTIHLVSEISSRLSEEEFNRVLSESGADVLLDFTHPESALYHVGCAFRHGIAPVVGTSGLSLTAVQEMEEWSKEYHIPGIWVPNFSLTAVLLMHCTEIIAKWISDVEIVEYHHDQKADAPSGTAIETARRIVQSRKRFVKPQKKITEIYSGSLGACVDNVPVHAVRLPGLMAHQEVIFGAFGELLTLRYDNYDRRSYFKGIELAVTKVREKNRFIVGLDDLLF